MYIVLAILAFGIIIAVHELGHFFTAKALNVKVLEMSIGMGPKILSKQGKETLYSLRLIPFGGFCNMEGEYGEQLEKDDDDSRGGGETQGSLAYEGAPPGFAIEGGAAERINNDFALKNEQEEPDPRSFIAQSYLKRFLILAAGSVANLIIAFIIILVLSMGAEGFGSTTVESVGIDSRLEDIGESEILQGDRIVAINGERLYYLNDYYIFMNLHADKPIVLTLLRDGEKLEYQRRPHMVGDEEVYRYSLTFRTLEPTFFETLKFSTYQTFNFIRMIRVSIAMMVSGAASVTEVAGPVGIISAMNDVGRESPNILAAIGNIVYFTAFIGVNVAAINLLPIPAMDGGRILFLFITWVFEKATRRRLDPKYENYINTGAFVLLIGLMALIMFNDVMRILSN